MTDTFDHEDGGGAAAMSRADFATLLDRCGSREARWPAELRPAIAALLERDARAQAALRAARDLDVSLDAFDVAVPDMTRRIMDAIPLSRSERLLAWLFPGGGGSVLRPVLAGTLPLIVGTLLGLALPQGSGSQSPGWEAQERQLMAPVASEVWYE